MGNGINFYRSCCWRQKCVYCGQEIPFYEDLFARNAPERKRHCETKTVFAGGILYAYRYEDIVRTLIHQFKYNDMPRYSMFIAQRMAEFLHGLRGKRRRRYLCADP